MQRLISWSLALPLMLFSGVRPAESFTASTSRTRNNKSLVLRILAVWASAILLFSMLSTAVIQLLAIVLAPSVIHSVLLLVILFGSLILAGREIQPSGIPKLIQGIILFTLIASDVFLRYRVRVIRVQEA